MIDVDLAVEAIKNKLSSMNYEEREAYLKKMGFKFEPDNKKVYLSEKNRKKLESIINEIVLFTSKNSAVDCIYYTCETESIDDKTEENIIAFGIILNDLITSKHLNLFDITVDDYYEKSDLNLTIKFFIYNKQNSCKPDLLNGEILFDRAGIFTQIQQNLKERYLKESKSECLYEYSNSFEFEPSLNIQKIKKL